MLDPRLGKIGGTDTIVCAVTGQAVGSGMIRYSLGNGYYFRVKPQAQRYVNDELNKTLKSLIPSDKKPRKQTKVEEVTNNDN